MTTKYIKKSDLEPTLEGFIEFLVCEGHIDLAWTLAAKLQHGLPVPKKNELIILRNIFRNTFKNKSAERKMNAMLLVTSSGWSQEPDLVIPGGKLGSNEIH